MNKGAGVVEERKGYDEDNYNLGDLKISFVFENLSSDPRYTAMLKKIGLDK
jgi:hypothetical protein